MRTNYCSRYIPASSYISYLKYLKKKTFAKSLPLIDILNCSTLMSLKTDENVKHGQFVSNPS